MKETRGRSRAGGPAGCTRSALALKDSAQELFEGARVGRHQGLPPGDGLQHSRARHPEGPGPGGGGEPELWASGQGDVNEQGDG